MSRRAREVLASFHADERPVEQTMIRASRATVATEVELEGPDAAAGTWRPAPGGKVPGRA